MFGGMFQTADGYAWFTPQSTPLRLTQRIRVRSSITNAVARASGFVSINKNYPFMVFFCGESDGDYQVVPTISQVTGGINYDAISYAGNNTTDFYLTVYVFSSQPKSGVTTPYGASFYDENGNLILDSSDRVLTDLNSISQGPTTFSGKKAFTPALAGGRLYQVSGGGPGGVIVPVSTAFSCNYRGGQTIVGSDTVVAPPAASLIVGGFILNNTVSVIDASRYD